MQRRRFIEAVAALAAARWEEEGYDPEDLDGWEPMAPGSYRTGKFAPSLLTTSGEGSAGHWLVEDANLDARSLEIHYDSGGVKLSFEGTGDALRGGMLAELQPAQARRAAAALYQAAEELDARRGIETASR